MDKGTKMAIGGILPAVTIPRLISAILILLIGTFIFFINLNIVIHSFTYVDTLAQVVEIRRDADLELYYPIYEYRVNGEKIKVEGIPENNKEDIVIGSVQQISYNPKNPTQIDIGKPRTALFFTFFGFLMMSISIGIIFGVYRAFKNIKKI